MPVVTGTGRRISAPALRIGDVIAGGTVRSVMRLAPYDVIPGSVTVCFSEGGSKSFEWADEVQEMETTWTS